MLATISNLRVWSVNPEGFFTGIVPSEYIIGVFRFSIGKEFESMYYLIPEIINEGDMFSRPTEIPYYKNELDKMFEEWLRENKLEKPSGDIVYPSNNPVVIQFLMDVQIKYGFTGVNSNLIGTAAVFCNILFAHGSRCMVQ